MSLSAFATVLFSSRSFVYIATIKEYFITDLKKHVSKSLFLPIQTTLHDEYARRIRIYLLFVCVFFSACLHFRLTNTRLKSSVIYAYQLFYIFGFLLLLRVSCCCCSFFFFDKNTLILAQNCSSLLLLLSEKGTLFPHSCSIDTRKI